MLSELLSAPVWAVEFLYGFWAIVGTCVSYLAAKAFLWQRRRNGMDKTAVMLLAIFLGWSGSSTVRFWFMAWLLLDKPGWMLASWYLVLMCLDVIAGASLHIWSFLSEHRRRAKWLAIMGVSAAISAAAVFIQHVVMK